MRWRRHARHPMFALRLSAVRGLMLVPTAILLLTASVGRSIDWVRKVAYIALVGLALVGLGAVLFSGGFTIAFV